MNIQKYRKLYLQTNWGNNKFNRIIIRSHRQRNIYRKDNYYAYFNKVKKDGWNHNLVYNGNAFWINNYELCIGYELAKDHKIYRPIFSYNRQNLLNKVNNDIINSKIFWNKVKSKYFHSLSHIIKLPIECVHLIVMFISK